MARSQEEIRPPDRESRSPAQLLFSGDTSVAEDAKSSDGEAAGADFFTNSTYGSKRTGDRGHRVVEVRRNIALAAEVFELKNGEWREMKKGVCRIGVVAGLIRRRSLVENGWRSEHPHMGARGAVSQTIKLSREYIQTNRSAREKSDGLENLSDSID